MKTIVLAVLFFSFAACNSAQAGSCWSRDVLYKYSYESQRGPQIALDKKHAAEKGMKFGHPVCYVRFSGQDMGFKCKCSVYKNCWDENEDTQALETWIVPAKAAGFGCKGYCTGSPQWQQIQSKKNFQAYRKGFDSVKNLMWPIGGTCD